MKKELSKQEFEKAVNDSMSNSDVCRILGFSINGTGFRKVKKLVEEHSVDISHFDGGYSKREIKYPTIEKECPVCKNIFKTKRGSCKEKETCSYACSNTYFRSGENNPNWKEINSFSTKSRRFSAKYRRICFENHEHKCCVCDEIKMLDVHHFDENRKNNNPENLIPICATHHNYLHSVYRDEIINKVIEYRENYIKNKTTGISHGM